MRPLLLALPLLLAVPACEARAPADAVGAGPIVVATIHPLASIARAVAGDAVRVRTLLPPGAHPDTYQSRPRDARSLLGADLLVRVGGAADDWIGSPEGVQTLVMIDGMPLQGGNPHVWLDPILVRDRFLPRLTDSLVALAPGSADAIRGRGDAYADSLTALDAEIRGLLADLPERRFVAAHAAWPYFAARYDLDQAGVVHASPGHEPGGRALARLVTEARERGVRAVIAEPQLADGGVEAIASELRGRVGVADPVGGPALDGRQDYLSLMRYNARVFARALGGEAS